VGDQTGWGATWFLSHIGMEDGLCGCRCLPLRGIVRVCGSTVHGTLMASSAAARAAPPMPFGRSVYLSKKPLMTGVTAVEIACG